MNYMTTTFEPFSFSWQRTEEINDLRMKGYVFPALTDAILLPDMFEYKYNDPDDGNYDELHYMQHLEDRGGCGVINGKRVYSRILTSRAQEVSHL